MDERAELSESYGRDIASQSLGYEPWFVGFEDSWLPSAHVHKNNMMR